jgi:hypothetical protein
VIDRFGWIIRRWPTDPSRAFCFGAAIKVGKIRELTLSRTQGFQRVKRRNAWPRLLKVETRIRQ